MKGYTPSYRGRAFSIWHTRVSPQTSGQRNHINKFRKLYPDAVYRELTPADRDKVDAFWHEFHKVFNKEDADATNRAP